MTQQALTIGPNQKLSTPELTARYVFNTEAGAKEFSTMHRETQTKKPVEGVVIPSPNFFAKMWPQKELALAAGRRAIAAGGARGQCVSGRAVALGHSGL
jgi:hypothetical protein